MNHKDLKRQSSYLKDSNLENFLSNLNTHLQPMHNKLLDCELQISKPVFFIIGPQRSGTTILQQLIINRYKIWYPNNFISRFWNAPIIGNYLSDLAHLSHKVEYQSDLGYTKGPQGPHEFGYFWKRWFPDHFKENLQIDLQTLYCELANMIDNVGRPLLFKNLIFVDNYLDKIYDLIGNECRLIRIKRDPFFVIQSTYESRLKLFGDEKAWFGVKPPGYEEMCKMDVWEQIVAQVFEIEKHMDTVMSKVPASQILVINYSDLINKTEEVFERLDQFMDHVEIENAEYESIISGDEIRLKSEQEQIVRNYISKYFS